MRVWLRLSDSGEQQLSTNMQYTAEESDATKGSVQIRLNEPSRASFQIPSSIRTRERSNVLAETNEK